MERKEHQPIQKAVRSLVVSLATPEEIYQSFLNQHGENPPLLRFYIAQKGKGENRRYTFLGGKINPNEDFSEAIQREIAEELGFTPLGIPEQTIIGQWRYSSPKSGEREVMLTYNPTLPSENPSIGDPKIVVIKVLNFPQLRQLIEEDQLDGIPIEGHLAINSQEEISISPEEAEKRDQSMKKLLSWMGHIEAYLQKRFSDIIHRDNAIISLDEFQKEYEKILAEFMRKGIKAAIKEKQTPEEERNRHPLIEALDSGFLGKDILYFLPELAQHGVNWSGLDEATEGVKTFVSFLKEVFDDFLQQQGLTEEQFRTQIRSQDITLNEKINLINALNIFSQNRLKEIFGVTNDDLEIVFHHIQDFFRDLSNEMKIADPNLTAGLYQDFVLTNEINNANFGYLLSLFLGYDTKENNPTTQRLIRFEAGRQLTLLLKSLAGLKHYQKEISRIRNGRMQNAINDFFGPIVSEEIISLDENNQMRIRIRERDGKRYIVDEKPTKSFTSFLRKSFEEKFKDIRDFYSISLVILQPVTNQDQVKSLINEFIKFLETQFPSSQIRTEDIRTYGTENYFSQQQNKKLAPSGKRGGSQSNRMVRTKLHLYLDEEVLELTIYPYFSIKGSLDDFYWGWLEKITDDKNYVVRRMLAQEKGFPSMYDLLFPPPLYPHHYKHKLNSTYHK